MKEQGWDVGRMQKKKRREEERVTSVNTKLKTLSLFFFPVNGEVLKYQSKELDVVSEGVFQNLIFV